MALHPRSVQPDLDIVLAPLVALVDPAVPDRDRAGTVLVIRDASRELAVLERVVLHLNSEIANPSLHRQSLRDRP
jgi:hypothetical protein